MTYAYGTKGAPAIGGGVPGLPRATTAVGADPAGPPLQAIVIRESGTYVTPSWAAYARVTAIGRGGRGRGGTSGLPVGVSGAHGGGGAGLAASDIEAAPPGTVIGIDLAANAALVSFLGYQLSAGNGGDATLTAGGVGGIGTGGAINFNGGAGATQNSSNDGGGGGGAAGRGGNGASSINAAGAASGPGDALTTGGGGGGGATNGSGVTSAPGPSRTDASQLGAVVLGTTRPATTTNSNGGDGGGGAGGAVTAVPNVPGGAVVLIELW